MNPRLPDAALDFGATAARAFTSLGGVDAARGAEEDPGRRREAGEVLSALGIDELDPREDAETLAAAATLCEAAGRVALPYPLPSVLLRHADGLPFAVVPDDRCRVDHGDLFGRWRVARVDGRGGTAVATGPPLGSRLGPFVADLRLESPLDTTPSADVAAYLTLSAWHVVGTLQRSVELAVDHVRGDLR